MDEREDLIRLRQKIKNDIHAMEEMLGIISHLLDSLDEEDEIFSQQENDSEEQYSVYFLQEGEDSEGFEISSNSEYSEYSKDSEDEYYEDDDVISIAYDYDDKCIAIGCSQFFLNLPESIRVSIVQCLAFSLKVRENFDP